MSWKMWMFTLITWMLAGIGVVLLAQEKPPPIPPNTWGSIGRFQAVTHGEFIYVLDTRDGKIWRVEKNGKWSGPIADPQK
jgi:hypothetical protein